MSAIAAVLRGHGPPGVGDRPQGVRRPRPPAGRGRRRRRRPRRRQRRPDVDLVAVSTAIPDRNPELRRGARARHPGRCAGPRCSPPSAPPAARWRSSGTHGKTTTSSMLALALRRGGLRPVVHRRRRGQRDRQRRGVGRHGEWFVVEADESDGTFLELPAEVVVVTNVEPDHLDHYGDARRPHRRLRPLPRPGRRASRWCAPTTRSPLALGRRHGATTYGTARRRRLAHRRPACRAASACASGSSATASDLGRGRTCPCPGLHNARNAAAALAAAAAIGRRPSTPAAPALARYAGVARRFEFRGEAGGVTFVDDYAHLPGEVARRARPRPGPGGWGRVVVRVPAPPLQPHRRRCGASSGRAFADADVRRAHRRSTPPARRPRRASPASSLVDAVLDAHPWKRVAWLPDRADVAAPTSRPSCAPATSA